MNTQEITTSVITTSISYNEMALDISKKLSAALAGNEIDFSHFLSLNAHLVQPLIAQSTKMVFDASLVVTGGIAQNFQSIEQASSMLKKQIKQISKVEKLIIAGASILTTAALVATFIAAPNPASALTAATSLGNLIDSLKDADEA